MKKLLLLLLLVGFNAEAIDKDAKYSTTGLEGIDDFGIRVGVENYKHLYKDFDQKAIANQVELRLRQAKLDYNDKGRNVIIINPYPVILSNKLMGYSMQITVMRNVRWIAKSVEYETVAVLWSRGGISSPSPRAFIDGVMDEFLLDYLKANPKKKED